MEEIKIAEYTYDLPAEKIALHPVVPRDASKLLVYEEDKIQDSYFFDLPKHIPENTLLIYNNTKVVQARLFFKNTNGANIEIFCLSPLNKPVQESMYDTETSDWMCLVGNLSKFREDKLVINYNVSGTEFVFSAHKIGQTSEGVKIKFSWNSQHNFAEILHIVGNIPLPPYFKREATKADEDSYQTVFAELKGSVAAPTAGLHFTEKVMHDLKNKNCLFDKITLHVGAGTFMPVKADLASNHTMHAEEFLIEKKLVEQLFGHKKNVASVGTTSLRTLESIYWLGVQLCNKKNIDTENCFISQWEAYATNEKEFSKEEALQALLDEMKKKETEQLRGKTQIMIMPGYTFKIVDILITNFHQPQSTLLLLVAAFTNNWKKIYDHALQNNYRFLSYGDSSVLFRK